MPRSQQNWLFSQIRNEEPRIMLQFPIEAPAAILSGGPLELELVSAKLSCIRHNCNFRDATLTLKTYIPFVTLEDKPRNPRCTDCILLTKRQRQPIFKSFHIALQHWKTTLCSRTSTPKPTTPISILSG